MKETNAEFGRAAPPTRPHCKQSANAPLTRPVETNQIVHVGTSAVTTGPVSNTQTDLDRAPSRPGTRLSELGRRASGAQNQLCAHSGWLVDGRGSHPRSVHCARSKKKWRAKTWQKSDLPFPRRLQTFRCFLLFLLPWTGVGSGTLHLSHRPAFKAPTVL